MWMVHWILLQNGQYVAIVTSRCQLVATDSLIVSGSIASINVKLAAVLTVKRVNQSRLKFSEWLRVAISTMYISIYSATCIAIYS